jgi:hypothetical protein
MTVAADPRKPGVQLRRRRRANGTVSVKTTVRWTDQDGTRRRRGFETFEEADLERARLALELAQTGTIGGTKDNTLAALWPIYRADAVARLAEATIISYDRCWSRHLSPRFGDVPLDEITPRSVAQWHAGQGHRPRDRASGDGVVAGCSRSASSGARPSATPLSRPQGTPRTAPRNRGARPGDR